MLMTPHVKQLKQNSTAGLNILKCLSKSTYSADQTSLMLIYKAIIRSKLDYGSIIYSNACKTVIKSLDVVTNSALRIVTGAFRTSPVPSIYNIANELPPEIHRTKTLLNYARRILDNTSHPNYSFIINPPYLSNYSNQHKFKQPATVRIHNQLQKLSINPNHIMSSSNVYNNQPPWTIKTITIAHDLCTSNKNSTNPIQYKQKFYEALQKYEEYLHIYTDGSKTATGTGCALMCETYSKSIQLNKHTTIYTAELLAIKEAFQYAHENTITHSLILTDSRSSIQSLNNIYTTNIIIRQIQEYNTKFKTNNRTAVVMWIPAHIGIKGNEDVDQYAKNAANNTYFNQQSTNYTSTDLKNEIKHKLNDEWQERWHNMNDNKLHRIKPDITKWTIPEEWIHQKAATRVRIGHTKLTHHYVLAHSQPPTCETCRTQLTVKHIIEDCPKYNSLRQKLKIKCPDVYKNTQELVQFLKETNLMQSL